MENYLNKITKDDITLFASDCGYTLINCLFYGDYFLIKLIDRRDKEKELKYPINYELLSFEVLPHDSILRKDVKDRLSSIQKKWREFLKNKFGKNYIEDYNAWLEEQKLSI